MIKLPLYFIATRFEDYYLNIRNMCLYSLKRTGALRELKHYSVSPWRTRSGYTVSVSGDSHTLSDSYLESVKINHLKNPKDVEIGVTNVYTNVYTFVYTSVYTNVYTT